MRIVPLARLATVLLVAMLTGAVATACDGGENSPGSPVTGDGRPDGQGGTAALDFRLVLDAQPVTAGDPSTGAPADVAEARERRQSTSQPVQQEELDALDCASDPLAGAGGLAADRPLVACAADGTEKFVLDATTLTGEDVQTAVADQSPDGTGWVVTIDFTDAGTAKWSELTQQAVGERVAFTVRGVVVSAPTVNEPILGGATQISGQFTREDVEDLVRQITGG